MRALRHSEAAGFSLVIALSSLSITAQADSVNSSIRIDDGMTIESQSTVNGHILLGDNVTVTGSLRAVNGAISVGNDAKLKDVSTVNGRISLGSGTQADALESVNGNITVEANAAIAGDIEAVNGRIQVAAGSVIGGDVENVNGAMRLQGSHFEGGVTTVNGDVWLTDAAVLEGDLHVRKPRSFGFWGRRTKPKVVIGPNSRVLGNIIADREIELYISDSAEVAGARGQLSMDDSIAFSGAEPDF